MKKVSNYVKELRLYENKKPMKTFKILSYLNKIWLSLSIKYIDKV
jgi:hypothetical protein